MGFFLRAFKIFFCIFQAQKAHKAHFGDWIEWNRKAKQGARKTVGRGQEPGADSWPQCPAPCCPSHSGSWTQPKAGLRGQSCGTPGTGQ